MLTSSFQLNGNSELCSYINNNNILLIFVLHKIHHWHEKIQSSDQSRHISKQQRRSIYSLHWQTWKRWEPRQNLDQCQMPDVPWRTLVLVQIYYTFQGSIITMDSFDGIMCDLLYCREEYLHARYHDCWWHGDTRRHDVSSHGIDLCIREYSSLTTGKITFLKYLTFNMHTSAFLCTSSLAAPDCHVLTLNVGERKYFRIHTKPEIMWGY